MDWGLIGTILAPLFFITTVVLALKLHKRKQPVWSYKTEKIIGLGSKAPPELKLTFADKSINDLYRTLIIFFNRGNEAIRAEDVKKKVMIDFGAAEILREPLILEPLSRPEIEFSARRVSRGASESNELIESIELDFSFLDHNDGAIVEVLHTQSEPKDCSAIIIGARKIRRIKEFVTYHQLSFDRSTLRDSLIILLIFQSMVVVTALDKNWESLTMWVSAWAVGLLLVLIRWYYRYRKFPKWTSGIE